MLITVGVIVHQTRRYCRHREIQSTDVAGTKDQKGSRAQSGVSRRNTADPISAVSRRNTADPISSSSARMSLAEQDFEQGAASEEYGAYQEALQWYRKAADQGYAPAQLNLGALYAEGHGVAVDFQIALQWYRKAADQGYAPAQFNLGVMYLAGQGGIAKDYMAAYVWFSLAAVQGYEDAKQAQQKIVTRLTAEQQTQAQQWLLAKMPDRNSRRSQRG